MRNNRKTSKLKSLLRTAAGAIALIYLAGVPELERRLSLVKSDLENHANAAADSSELVASGLNNLNRFVCYFEGLEASGKLRASDSVEHSSNDLAPNDSINNEELLDAIEETFARPSQQSSYEETGASEQSVIPSNF